MNEETQALMFSSKNQGWRTPKPFFARLDSEYHFTTDVGATRDSALKEDYLGLDNGRDALLSEWGKVSYCNPPYGREIGKWVKKAHDEAKTGKIIVMLLPARVDTKWFHDYIFGAASEIRFICGRLKFEGVTTKSENIGKFPAPFPSMVVIYDFRTAHHGTIFTKMSAQ
jgi:phage N-6-adenine-methyltransferase